MQRISIGKLYDWFYGYPILDKRISVLGPPPSVTLRLPPLDSETGWTGELWSKTNLLKWKNKKIRR